MPLSHHHIQAPTSSFPFPCLYRIFSFTPFAVHRNLLTQMGNVPPHQPLPLDSIPALRNMLSPINWQDDDSCEMHTTINTINNSLMHAVLQDVECSSPREPRTKRSSRRVAFSVPADEPASPDKPSTAPPSKTLKATFTTFFPRTRSCDS